MSFSHSHEVDPALYETDGLGIDVPLRMHKDWTAEEKGAKRMQREWSQYVYPLEGYHGELGARYHFVSVTMPGCLPERLEVIAYANEFAFLYDGIVQTHD
jgi:hypothetical protein